MTDESVITLYSQIIDSINAHIRAWNATEGMEQHHIDEAIARALLAEAAYYHGNIWGLTKDEFRQRAEREYDFHCSPEAFGWAQ